MMDLAMRDFAVAGAAVELIPGGSGMASNVRARFHHPQGRSPGILVLCHLETVHPLGTLAALPWRVEGDRCYGPGLFDMKGGTFLAFPAMKALQRKGAGTALPVTFLLTCDEEIANLIAGELGFAIPSQSSAGGSDGNFSSLPERGRLLAGLLARLS